MKDKIITFIGVIMFGVVFGVIFICLATPEDINTEAVMTLQDEYNHFNNESI